MAYVTFHSEKCVYCDLCAGVCSLTKLERVQPSAACIQITRDTSTSFGEMRCSVCDMTHDRECVESCPANALVWDAAAGVVRFVEEECTDCGSCLDACPNVHQDAVSRRIMICDLCGGDPQCVKWCPEGALTWESAS
jgi:anaerobic carbon-monoxide dehydrogenase iron sulfur subunit